MLNLYADKSTCVSLSRVFREMHLQLKQNTAEKAALAVLDCLPVAAGDHA